MNKLKQQNSLAVANFFIRQPNNRDVDNLKLNKLVYLALGFCLGIESFDLFKEEVQAWEYGPVIPEIYHRFKDKKIKDGRIQDKDATEEKIKEKNSEISELLSAVWRVYNGVNGVALIKLTHQIGTPWSLYYNGTRNKIIDKKFIKEYYKVFLDKYEH